MRYSQNYKLLNIMLQLFPKAQIIEYHVSIIQKPKTVEYHASIIPKPQTGENHASIQHTRQPANDLFLAKCLIEQVKVPHCAKKTVSVYKTHKDRNYIYVKHNSDCHYKPYLMAFVTYSVCNHSKQFQKDNDYSFKLSNL